MFSQAALRCHYRSVRLTAAAGVALASGLAGAQAPTAAPPMPSMPGMPGMPAMLPEFVFVCPLDRSIRSLVPGECGPPGQRVELVAEVPEPIEFPVELTTAPTSLQPGEPATFRFTVRDPWKNNVVSKFTLVHGSPFHAFVVSEDLEYFLHDHPRREGDGFELPMRLPRAGHYRVLADFLPEAATPQLAVKSVLVPGGRMATPTRARDYSPKQAENLHVELTVTPEEPVAGSAATLLFHVAPEEGLELFVGAPAHLFAASGDLIDLIHAHPLATVPSSTVSFSVLFPRAATYRVWVQFQRDGVVNTAHFDVPVRFREP
jgi:hypothetical protein